MTQHTNPESSGKLSALSLSALVDQEQMKRVLLDAGLINETPAIIDALVDVTSNARHGDLDRWLQALKELPNTGCLPINLAADSVVVGQQNSLTPATTAQLESALRKLIPWRKGPYSICGVNIDTEWRSDWKWQRLAPHIQALDGRRILDVGCGNGYHLWRMLGAGATLALGVDPVVLFAVQFGALQNFIRSSNAALLPMRLEQLPADLGCFDTVFSMGVLYHHKHPVSHLEDLRGALVPDGELVLESLVMPPGHPTLVPEGRYARMRNIGQIPNSRTLEQWVRAAGFENIRLVSEETTSLDEQRTTTWMPFDSLVDALEPDELPTEEMLTSAGGRLTIEGYPAPRRAILIGRRPPTS